MVVAVGLAVQVGVGEGVTVGVSLGRDVGERVSVLDGRGEGVGVFVGLGEGLGVQDGVHVGGLVDVNMVDGLAVGISGLVAARSASRDSESVCVTLPTVPVGETGSTGSDEHLDKLTTVTIPATSKTMIPVTASLSQRCRAGGFWSLEKITNSSAVSPRGI